MDFNFCVHYPQVHNTGIGNVRNIVESMDIEGIDLDVLGKITVKQVPTERTLSSDLQGIQIF